MTAAADVIAGKADYSCEAMDCIEWFGTLPDDSIDLFCGSPPYLRARTYSRDDVARGIEEWTAWMIEVVKAAAPKVKGLIAINCEGQTENYAYQPAPQMLATDLFRAGFNLRRPLVFHRVGIPGSGGPDWVRGDTESIICITRTGKLPWSDNTAMGHPPKWAPGGEMAYRLSDGTRTNQWGKTGVDTGVGGQDSDGKALQNSKPRPSHKVITKNAHGVRTDKPVGTRVTGNKDAGKESYRAKSFCRAPDGTVKGGHKREIPADPRRERMAELVAEGMSQREAAREVGYPMKSTAMTSTADDTINGDTYVPPVLANPGNVIQQTFTASEVADILGEPNDVLALKVGGGMMGHPCAHANEAPFPLDLPAFFVRSWCPPGGIVCDPWSGSGTTCHAAFENGRRFVGCDVRQSQVDLCEKRMRTVTRPLFT
jgi:hypothetical protein